jgi:hypothetical protein
LKRLNEGNARYASNNMQQKDFSADRAQRAAAQYPIAAILSCADSHVAPELFFDQAPGIFSLYASPAMSRTAMESRGSNTRSMFSMLR